MFERIVFSHVLYGGPIRHTCAAEREFEMGVFILIFLFDNPERAANNDLLLCRMLYEPGTLPGAILYNQ